MSSFCFVIALNAGSKEQKIAAEELLTLYAEQLNIGVQFDGFYNESLLEKYTALEDCLVCNLSDNKETVNCEKLLCFDGCNRDIWPELPSLKERLRIIADFVVKALQFGAHVELFIGTSGDDADDFLCATCDDGNVMQTLIGLFDCEDFLPTVHIIVRRTQQDSRKVISGGSLP